MRSTDPQWLSLLVGVWRDPLTQGEPNARVLAVMDGMCVVANVADALAQAHGMGVVAFRRFATGEADSWYCCCPDVGAHLPRDELIAWAEQPTVCAAAAVLLSGRDGGLSRIAQPLFPPIPQEPHDVV